MSRTMLVMAFTLAQKSNFLTPTAKGYDLWRKYSLSLLSRQAFSLQQENALMLEWLNPVPGQKYLDVGCSTGNYARALHNAGATVTAIDISPAFIKEAKSRKNNQGIQFEIANAENLPYANCSFDGVTVGATLNEFYSTEAALKEMARVLKPGGKIFFMYLQESNRAFATIAQEFFKLSGLRFPKAQTIEQTLQQHGLCANKNLDMHEIRFDLFLKT